MVEYLTGEVLRLEEVVRRGNNWNRHRPKYKLDILSSHRKWGGPRRM